MVGEFDPARGGGVCPGRRGQSARNQAGPSVPDRVVAL